MLLIKTQSTLSRDIEPVGLIKAIRNNDASGGITIEPIDENKPVFVEIHSNKNNKVLISNVSYTNYTATSRVYLNLSNLQENDEIWIYPFWRLSSYEQRSVGEPQQGGGVVYNEVNNYSFENINKGFVFGANKKLEIKDKIIFPKKYDGTHYRIAASELAADFTNFGNCDFSKVNVIHIYSSGYTDKLIFNIADLKQCTSLRECFIEHSAGISGDISNLSKLTQATMLVFPLTNVSGDISSLANLINLTNLSLSGTNVSGDISNIVTNLTKLTYLGIPSTVTITDAQKKTLTDRGCTVRIS